MQPLRALLCAVVAFCAALTSLAQAPAFPGAEGYARFAVSGGRGGRVVHVTTLADSGPGSLREALEETAGPRMVVFDVAGYIDLKSDLVIKHDSVTIAGQTAPEPGITIRYFSVNNKASNVIMRFIRVRRSQVRDVNDGADACSGSWRSNIILDHCSFSWSIDEVASYYDNRNFTMQWCSVSESLNNSGHNKGAHGYGGIWGGKGASFHHNLIAHHNNRTPRINSGRYGWSNFDSTRFANTVMAERVDLRNCVMYNWGKGPGPYGNMGGYLNIVGNYYKAGPSSADTTKVFQCSVDDGHNKIRRGTMGQYFVSGNYMASVHEENYDWKGMRTDGSPDFTFVDSAGYFGTPCARLSIRIDAEVDSDIVEPLTTTHSACVAYDRVLSFVGASLYRDEVDLRHVSEVRAGTATFSGTVGPGIVDRVNDPDGNLDPSLPSFPKLTPAARPADYDTDRDGMPDAWETLNGLNPADPTDANTYTLDPRGFYTNVEVYINSIVEPIVRRQNEGAISPVQEYFPRVKTL